jgi:hypothetical protein
MVCVLLYLDLYVLLGCKYVQFDFSFSGQERGNIIAIGYGASQCAYPRIPNYVRSSWSYNNMSAHALYSHFCITISSCGMWNVS